METRMTLNFIERMTLDEYLVWRGDNLEFVDEYNETGLVTFPEDDYPSSGRTYYVCWEGDMIAIYQVTGMEVIHTITYEVEQNALPDE